MILKTFTRTELTYVLTTKVAEAEDWDPVKLALAPSKSLLTITGRSKAVLSL